MKKKILVIEDDNILRKAILFALEEEGFDIVYAIDGDDGFEKVKTEKPDLVLLDLMLPKTPGEKVLKDIKSSKTLKDIPVIVFSAKSDDASIVNCVDVLGANDFLIKSNYSLEEMIEKIKKNL
ncbi:hypothetical protein A2331_04200 [Candidatus Falkowbacteria bacterium RIFOXYB2_FULL_34_18]|uniref:Response regulatory domain-containing protein n=1 Tax=Candidatus Falkowbacteria bacterium RIFOXYD2_FULL_34_120 TaxID=1798007 RepID=A0A1F5TPB9_9BACT|nr:MAG: hypothetical protein A2500_00055 [Candidatus Falkowbacteria bacterium RIFOXYC12_FULL_34_55]OGF28829.1 MAG: hypothetical protein A2331_04200 [Candidatus Falkowbacteria bacterium RIFOXYB2_FULL_34_18]OGF38381.1 MAG: hypothetical protein A2515_06510 [Candidatus Falkowbacteria bacterium RIFOXYD12_FULL_34_57]OGF40371.1 MAG: hypothetical protein A2531_00115 [Candidatus Falkowbacteria bacterium RIFOXYD2_FULL_34_120]